MSGPVTLPKRFYKHAHVDEAPEGGFSVRLDTRPVRTPGRAELSAPTRALAEAIAEEWNAQGEKIDPATMPLTRLANTIIDGVLKTEQQVRDDIAAYAGTDLVCYRAGHPEGLVAAQQALWDPVLEWAASSLPARFAKVEGIVHVRQPEEALQAVRAALAGHGAWMLAPLHVVTTLTGSALLALAFAAGAMTPEEVWAAAHVDEDWQISQWGEDAEAAARRARRRSEMEAAARLLALSRA
ncbi:MAG: ATP12 family protein [Pseudomonadota bacterium]|nr:ATP12 family protein [Pseudomonadota bacterium]